MEKRKEELDKAVALVKEKTPQSRVKVEELLKTNNETAFKTLLLQAIWVSKDIEMVEALKRVYSTEKDGAVKLKIKEAIGRLLAMSEAEREPALSDPPPYCGGESKGTR
jgi:hypothetical protein